MEVSEESLMRLKADLDKIMRGFCDEQGIMPLDVTKISVVEDCNTTYLRYDTELESLEIIS